MAGRGWKQVCRTVFVVAVVLLLASDAAMACPTCKDTVVHNDPAMSGMVQGYFWSILFMVSMPFILLFSLSGYFYWQVRKARAAGLGRTVPGLEPTSYNVPASGNCDPALTTP